MPADGKWVDGLTAQMKWAEAGQRILAVRLDAVEHNWQWALNESIDPEAVHQLRVSTRRARAAMQMFADILPKRSVQRLNDRLKKLRNVAGPARDWDVFLVHLHDWSADRPADEKDGLNLLTGSALAMRQSCQSKIAGSDRWRESWNEVRTKLVPRRGLRQSLGRQARRLVDAMFDEFQAAVEVENPNGEQLHQVRIAGKRLRYGLELFVDVLDPAIRVAWLPLMEEVQELLGLANDAHNALTQIAKMKQGLPRLGMDNHDRYAIGLDAWHDHLEKQIAGSRLQFADWRNRWRVARAESLGESQPES